MGFPSSPNNGDVYIKGSTPYIYSEDDNSWTQTTDANLTEENIKSGVSILGVDGIYETEISTLQEVGLSEGVSLYYYNIGKYYIMVGVRGSVFSPEIIIPPRDNTNTRNIICSALGITADEVYTINNPSDQTSSNTHSASYNGSTWGFGGSETNITTIVIILAQ